MKSAEKASSWVRPVAAGLFIAAVLAVLLVAGYLPRRNRERNLVRATDEQKTELPEVTVARVERSPALGDLTLPGNVTPFTEALINARASGYIKRRLADIGDKVSPGQLLAEIDSPELDEQVRQAEAGVSQSKAALAGAQQLLRQANARLNLARVTAQRWNVLVQKGVVSRQEADQRDADLEAQQATVESAQASVKAAEDNVQASEADHRRLVEMQAFEKVTAPFAGIITARNVDIGSLIPATGGPPLFRIAQIDRLRIMVDVPQSSAAFVRVGGAAEVTFQELPGRRFTGRISRTANALEPSTRTLPTEVEVANPGGVLLPNMFAQVRLFKVGAAATAMIPGDALIVRPNGTQVAVVTAGDRIHFQPIDVGRDFGQVTEVRTGLTGDEVVVVNATDDVREGAQVKPLMRESEAAGGTSPAASSGKRGGGPGKSSGSAAPRP
jgi:RND family efflux transporter MFP subunit